MTGAQNLYKRAISNDDQLAPLWYVGKGISLFAGCLTYNAPHSHSTSIYLAGLYGKFKLRLPGTDWMDCGSVVIPAGVIYELDVGGNPFFVLYLEPDIAGVDALVSLLGSFGERGGALVSQVTGSALIRDLYEDRLGMLWAGEAVFDLINFSKLKARRDIDPRISFMVQVLTDDVERLCSLDDMARQVGLSVSRLQHLFTKEMGVPFRRYRAWHRLRGAIGEVISGHNLTTAAHSAGYSDQAHFSNHFRNTFGAAPRHSLLNVRSG